MDKLWDEKLPGEYRKRVIKPVAFEHHAEPSANVVRVIGYDDYGAKCFDYHEFVLTDEGFDVDEFPILIDRYYERVFAWRLSHGPWVRIKSYSSRLDQCNRKLMTLPVELTETIQ